MKIPMLGAIALIGAGLISGPAFGAEFGMVSLRAGERHDIDIGSTGRNLRVCNDYFSAGSILVTIGDHQAHDLSPGICTEENGARMIVESHASGPATVNFQPICDGSDMGR